MKCSMESHISHIFADLFTSRPKAYSKKGLRQLLKIRLLKVNNIDIKKKYFNSLEYHPSTKYQDNSINKKINMNDYYKKELSTFIKPKDNYINFI